MRPLYYIIITITLLMMVAKNNGYLTTTKTISVWNEDENSWDILEETEESGWDLIYDENGNWVHVYETWTYKPGSLEPEHEVWINDTPLNKTIREGGDELGSFVEWIWNSYI